jgi:hypothetical protein
MVMRIWDLKLQNRLKMRIKNKDQHPNTYVSVWGLFLVGKIWASYSTTKSRFDKAITKVVPIKLFGTPSLSSSTQI